MSGWWGRWVALLSRKEPGETLALFRIAIGLCVLYAVGTVVWHGLVGVLWVDAAYGGYRSLGNPWWLITALGGATPTVIWSLVAVATGAGLALTVGAAPRLAALVAVQAMLALSWVNGHAGGSYDDLMTNALWLLVLADSGATWSVQCRRRHGVWARDALVYAWPRYLVIFQLALVYASTGSQKLSVYWTPGGDFSALYYILQQPTWHRIDMSWVAWVFPLTQLTTASVWFWEIGAPLLLLAYWFRDTRDRPGRLRAAFNRLDFRALYGFFGVAMHLGIFATMEVGPFTWVTLSYYLCLWHPDEWRALLRRRAARLLPAGYANLA